ncbi:DUF935 domain-containing protein [Hydrogenovibrio sp. 3SP14C1]|uniref:DUF935 domain-containing protein n=1 Tax=Hydrogenovibrio sp. 3SP14C1 TaxID=3038774 RepID=UPI00241762ED|nr:DUF935 domain-containing protein [Hydrogenovibrio sp. 3SP14C1]MDG4811669.1 DUF935 domain-containing protein [Hydrogenovibrio sp. 3SP14C1]
MEKVSNIVDQNGDPIRLKELSKEIATASMTGIRQVWNTDTIASGLTPQRLAQILHNANQGDAYDFLTLAEEMEEAEPHYGSVLGTRKRAIEGIAPSVEAASEDKVDIEMAETVSKLVKHESFSELVQNCVDGLGKGYAVSEIIWRRGQMWWPNQYKWRDPRFFQFPQDNAFELRLRDEKDMVNGLSLEPYKFVVHIPRLKSGIPIRGGLARLAAITYMCKQFTITDWMAFAEVFGMPIRIGKHGANATESDIATLINAVANIGTDAAAVIPDSMKIEFEDGRKSGSNDTFERLAKYLDKQISKAVIGQTMTTDDGSSQAQANVHNDVRLDILESDLKQLGSTVNRDVIKPFIDLNFGVQEFYPIVKFELPEAEDRDTLIKALEVLLPHGFRVGQSAVRTKLGIPEPKEGEDLFVAIDRQSEAPVPDPAMNHQKPCGCSTCQTKAINAEQGVVTVDDDLDELEQEAMQEWQPQIDPVVDPIVKLLSESKDYDDFLRQLPGMADQVDGNKLILTLAEQLFKARGVGDVG